MDGVVIVDRQREANVWNYDLNYVGLAIEDGDGRTTIVLNEAQTLRLVALLNEAIDAGYYTSRTRRLEVHSRHAWEG